jgi:hypothetical protein
MVRKTCFPLFSTSDGYGSCGVNTHAHNRKNDPSLWDTLAYRQEHILKDWNYKMAAHRLPSNNNFKKYN